MKITRTTLFVCCLFACKQFIQAAAPSGYVIEWGGRDTFTGTVVPVQLVLSNAVAISAGRIQRLALKSDGTVIQWSVSAHNQVTFDNIILTTGEGGFTDKSGYHRTHTNTISIVTNGVVKINGKVLNDVISVAIGNQFGIGLKRDGTVIGWGENYVPAGLTNITAIAAAGFTSLALKDDGTVVEWENQKGLPQYGQLLEVPIGSNVVAVAIGESPQGTRNLALKKDGMIAHWGEETDYKDATPPADLSNVVAVATGYNHSLALTRDGTVTGWGFNNAGQATGIPNTNFISVSAGQVKIGGQVLNNVASIAAGRGYSMALKKDGTVVTWGRMVNDLYPVTVPAGLSNVVAIAAGDNFCLAITTNSAVAARFRQK